MKDILYVYSIEHLFKYYPSDREKYNSKLQKKNFLQV